MQIQLEKNRQFLVYQRLPDRPSSLRNINMKTLQEEDQSQKSNIAKEDQKSSIFNKTESKFQSIVLISYDDNSPK